MTTTSQFQIKPDFYTDPQTCKAEDRKRVNTNPRYKFYDQTHFTAGDIEQFNRYRDPSNGRVCIPEINLENNLYNDFKMPASVYWEKYRNISPLAVDNTFSYLFHKFKKAIFVKIKNGKLRVFLPFSKKNFTNEWAGKIRVNPKYGDLFGFVRYLQQESGYKFYPNAVNKNIDTWYANNCLVRYEFPPREGDTNNTNASDMLKTLCEQREIPDMEFFINRRDFPLLKNDGTEPYSHMFDSESQPLLSHRYKQYCPVLSMVTTEKNADIPIPTGDDWARIGRPEGKFFSHTCERSFSVTKVPWESKKPIAVFRGASTGCGVTIDTNIRLKLAHISHQSKKDKDGLPLLDAGITEWNIRARKLQGEKYLQTIETKSLPFGLVGRLTPQQQAEYKYVINVDGHVSAYRLSLELESGFCVLLAGSKYKLWYREYLIPYQHYVPVKEDLSDLLDQIKWCKKNDSKCKEIAENAEKFSKKYLSKDGILDYLQKLLFEIKKVNGMYLYNDTSLKKLQYKQETIFLQNKNLPVLTGFPIIVEFPTSERTYGLLKGVQWAVELAVATNSLNMTEKKTIFSNNNTKVVLCEVGGYKIAKKTTQDIEMNTHEVFITTQVTNNLAKYIPNFCYVFSTGDSRSSSILMEYIDGITLDQYIKGEQFTMKKFIHILTCLSLSLHFSQMMYGFVHNDLTPWNIILKKLPQEVYIDYPIDENTVYQVKTDVIPVIIDMGRSHVIYQGRHYGLSGIRPFSSSTIQDLFTVLVTSLGEIASFPLDEKMSAQVVKLANFFTGGQFQSTFGNIQETKKFLSKMKKYEEIVETDKKDLEQKNPLQFVDYIVKNFGLEIQKKRVFNNTMNRGNPRQVLEYSLCQTDKERAKTFVDYLDRIISCELKKKISPFLAYYTVQTIYHNMVSVKELSMQIAGFPYRKEFDRKFNQIVQKLGEYIDQNLDGIQNEGILDMLRGKKIPDISKFFTEKLFLQPDNVLKLLQGCNKKFPEKCPDVSVHIEVILNTILSSETNFSLPEKIASKYKEIFRFILSIRNNLVDISTLRELSGEIYRKNLTVVKKKISQETGSCTDAKKFVKIYRAILQEV